MTKLKSNLLVMVLVVMIGISCSQQDKVKRNYSTDKTIIAWLKLNEEAKGDGAIISHSDGFRYDAIGVSMQNGGRLEVLHEGKREGVQISTKSKPLPKDKQIQIAAVYQGNHVSVFQDGELVLEYQLKPIEIIGSENEFVLFGAQNFGTDVLSCEIDDARIYRNALAINDIKKLIPNEMGDIKPYACWDFENESLVDKMGTFPKSYGLEYEYPELRDGKAIFKDWAVLAASKAFSKETPQYPEEEMPNDWPVYHLVHPGPGLAEPGDPNGAFFYNGRYHLHYIYQNQHGVNYAHVSSEDMVRWQWHPTVLSPPVTQHGMYSGTGFFTREGTPAMIYHGVGSGLNYIVFAVDEYLDQWSDPIPVKPVDDEGNFINEIDYWDPDIWYRNDTYFALSGGGDPEMMKSSDLQKWEYVGQFLHQDFSEEKTGISRDEDISCANMFQIGDKWMLLCISHELGCRYFLGDFVEDQFLPRFHAKMNWRNTDWENEEAELIFFAPESLLTPDNRRVMWAWLIDGGVPSGVQSLPRELELPNDGILRIRPLKELELLRYNLLTTRDILVNKDTMYNFQKIKGNALELKLEIAGPLPEKFGVQLLMDKDGRDPLEIKLDQNHDLIFLGKTQIPFHVMEHEDLEMRIFIDRDLVEVFFNERQAAAYRHKIRENFSMRFFTDDTNLQINRIDTWKMKSIYEGNLVFNSKNK